MRVCVCDMTQCLSGTVNIIDGSSHREHFQLDIECLLVLAQDRIGRTLITEGVAGAILIVHGGKDLCRFAVEIERFVVVAEVSLHTTKGTEGDCLTERKIDIVSDLEGSIAVIECSLELPQIFVKHTEVIEYRALPRVIAQFAGEGPSFPRN